MQESSLVHIDQVKNMRLMDMVIILEKLKAEWEKEKQKELFDHPSDDDDDDDGSEKASLPVNRD